jgi:hypothetical protein
MRPSSKGGRWQNWNLWEVLRLAAGGKDLMKPVFSLILALGTSLSPAFASETGLSDSLFWSSAGARALAGANVADPGELGNVLGSSAVLALEPRYDVGADVVRFAGGGWGYGLSAVDSETATYTMASSYRASTVDRPYSSSETPGWSADGGVFENVATSRVISSGFAATFLDDKAAVGLSGTHWKRDAEISGTGSGWRFSGGVAGRLHDRVVAALDASFAAFDEGAQGLEGEHLLQGGVRYQLFTMATVMLAATAPFQDAATVNIGAEIGNVERLAVRVGASQPLVFDVLRTEFAAGLHSAGALIGFDLSASVDPWGETWAWTGGCGLRLRF